MTRDEVAAILKYLNADCGIVGEPDTQKLDVWFNELKHTSLKVGWTAARIYMRRGMFSQPRLAELDKVLQELHASAMKIPDADQAFTIACNAIRKFGSWQQAEGMKSLPPVVRVAMENIGWREFCESENPPALRAHFKQAYEASRTRATKNAGLSPALQNILNGDASKLLEGA